MRLATRIATFFALFGWLLAGAPDPWRWTASARAMDGGSFLESFPENDRYRVQVWGDQMADGLLAGLTAHLAEEPRLVLDRRLRGLGGLLRVDIDQEARGIEAAMAASGRPHIVVVMLGAGDRLSLRRPGNRRVAVGSDEWMEEYGRRLDVVMRTLRSRSVAVFWVGLPVMRRQDVNDDAEMMNELMRSRALANGARYVDVFASFADADGAYSAHGPDLAGKTRLLRDQDGIHFTATGYRKLAYFVGRELRRAAADAWEERAIPLAGSEAEQARIRPPPTVKLAPLAPSATGAGHPGLGIAPAGGTGGIGIENSLITLRNLDEDGREESATVEILRPAIPAAVVAMLTRRESEDKPTHVGDPVMTEILGGLTVVSSVTPLGEVAGGRRQGDIGAGTPLHRVLLRGESLPPKPGRADEMPWPRPEPELDPRLAQALQQPVDAAAAVQAETTQALPSEHLQIPGGPPLPRRPSPWFEREMR